MRRVIAVSLVGFAALGSGAPKASAWPLDTLFYHHRFCAKVCCKQYNAFSPFCCEGAAGNSPMPGCGFGGSPGCSFAGDQGYLGELPAPGANGAPVLNAPATLPANGGPTSGSSVLAPGGNNQPLVPGVPPRPFPVWGGAGVANPVNAPGYYPGFTGYGVNGTGHSSPYPGFMGSGAMNGGYGPFVYPGFTGYGPASSGMTR